MHTKTEAAAIFLKFQQEEVDGAALYEKIAKYVRDEKNSGILRSIAASETRHAEIVVKGKPFKARRRPAASASP